MEKISLSAIGAGLLLAWWKVKSFWAFWSPVIDEIVLYIETLAKDGLITKDDRKAIALKSIDLIAQKKGKKIGWLEKVIISRLVDRYAGKLIPHDIKIPEIIDEVNKKKG